MVPDRQAIEIELLNFVRARGPRHAAVALDTDLLESGLLDSLMLTDFILYIEQTFGVQFDSDDISPSNFRTISAAVNLLLNRLLSTAQVSSANRETLGRCVPT